MQQHSDNEFVVDLLIALRRAHFSPRAWGFFLRRSWLMSCHTANANPTLQRSWRHVTTLIALLALAALIGNSIFAGLADTLRLLPGFIFCTAWQQSDLFWHLGLNRQARSGKLLPTVGIASTLTWLRGLGAAYLLGRLAGALATPSWLALAIFLCGGATDILDGLIARRAGTQSKLGQIADAEADFCLYLSLTIILLQNGALPLWVALVIALRFIIPFVAVLLSYFVFAQPVRFGSTPWGRYAGLAQCLYFLVLLAPPPLSAFARPLHTPLLIVMLCLLIAAPAAQIVANKCAILD